MDRWTAAEGSVSAARRARSRWGEGMGAEEGGRMKEAFIVAAFSPLLLPLLLRNTRVCGH